VKRDYLKYLGFQTATTMSGMYNSLKEVDPEAWDTHKNGSRGAVLAGHSQAVAKEVHVLAMELVTKRGIPYWRAESLILSSITGPAEQIKLNASLDKWSQPLKPGPNLSDNHKMSGQLMRGRQVVKSSKGKHPSNITPPKKKRK
jgi:hypothetical protein